MDNKELLQAFTTILADSEKSMNARFDNLEKRFDSLEKSMDAKLAALKSELVDSIKELEARNAEQHMDIKDSILSVEKEVKYLKHRLNKTDEDVFEIKDYLKIVK